MPKMKTAVPAMPQPTAAEWREGKKRALALLRDIETTSLNDMDFEDDCREGRPQQNVFYAHLFALLTTRNEGVQMAFSSVLTHFLGNDASADQEYLPKLARQSRQKIPITWPTKSRAKVSLDGVH